MDELLGLEYRMRIHRLVKDEIKQLLRDKQSPQEIIYIIERYLRVRVGKTTILGLFNQDKEGCSYKEREKEWDIFEYLLIYRM